MTIREAVQKAKKCLEEHQVPDYEIDALLLLQSVCGIDRARYYACAGEELPDADLYLEKVLLRAGRIPLQQITGEQYFCGLKFIVTEDHHFNVLKDIGFPYVKVLRIQDFVQL